jgi:hypothetical protein
MGRAIYSSDDGGGTWTLAASPPGPEDAMGMGLHSLLVKEATSSRLFASYCGLTLDRSMDGGRTWVRDILDGGCWGVGFAMAVDRSASLLLMGGESALDAVAFLWLDPRENPPPSRWGSQQRTSQMTGLNTIVADPTTDKAFYVGGEGSLAHLTILADNTIDLQFPWQASAAPSAPGDVGYLYILTLWPDPVTPGRVVYAGTVNGGGPLVVFESLEFGKNPIRIPVEGTPGLFPNSLTPLGAGSGLVLWASGDGAGHAFILHD